LIEEAWVEKPFATVALIATSNFITNNFVLIVLSVILLLFVLYSFSMSESWKKTIDAMLLKLPLVWDVYRNYIIASSSSILWSLMNSWVPIVKALNLVWKATNNVIYENLYSDVSLKVSTWKKLVDSISETDVDNEYFPSDFLQLLSVWEKTATIDKVCKKLNEQFSREVSYSLANLTKWVEPTAILIAWIFVLWFAFAIFGAILKLTQTIW
jgi:type II secretory pathway component PulF